MGKEREIKLRIADLPALRRRLRKLGARVFRPRVHEHNVLFDTADGSLAAREELLRVRTERPVARKRKRGQRSLVTFKRPLTTAEPTGNGEQYKVREEIELKICDPRALAMIFEGLGMRRRFQYEKFRTTFRLPPSTAWAKRLLIEIDETPIGVFLELEGPAKASIEPRRHSASGKATMCSPITWSSTANIATAAEKNQATCSSRRVKAKDTAPSHKNTNFFARNCILFLTIHCAKAYHCIRSKKFWRCSCLGVKSDRGRVK